MTMTTKLMDDIMNGRLLGLIHEYDNINAELKCYFANGKFSYYLTFDVIYLKTRSIQTHQLWTTFGTRNETATINGECMFLKAENLLLKATLENIAEINKNF